MTQLSQRENAILSLLEQTPGLSASDVHEALPPAIEDVSLVTIKRDLSTLTESGYLRRQGKGRAVTYSLAPEFQYLRSMDVGAYFDTPVDGRSGFESFNFSVFDFDAPLFTVDEKERLHQLHDLYRQHIEALSPGVIQKETERIIIELSWKSSHIEGNTYSLLETEALIKEKKEAEGHTEEEKIMILNHKEALDYIFTHKETFQQLSLHDIEDVHRLLVQDLEISFGLRTAPVGITGTLYRPLDNSHQIKEAMTAMCEFINSRDDFFEKSLLTTILLSYVQPFEDGNKRTSRLMSNGVLLANDSCPLSYRSIDEVEYKKALILFYEQNNISYIKEMFIDQFAFAVENYFKV